jgi:hypothetical protein
VRKEREEALWRQLHEIGDRGLVVDLDQPAGHAAAPKGPNMPAQGNALGLAVAAPSKEPE